ncbi:MAG: histidine phosphatase family protein [Thermoguttaceae bacterium]|jgi:probable phosphoglycerate mutase
MLRIVLIRPGTTDYDDQERIQGALDIPLNEKGRAEAGQIAEQLKDQGIELMYTAVCASAQQTAETIAERLDVKLRKLDRMQNVDHGLWQGLPISEVRHKQPKAYRQWQEQPENVCPPEGEMLNQAEDRVRSTMTRLLKRHKEGVIALVAPEPLATLVRHFVTQEELGDLWKSLGSHSQWEVLEVQAVKVPLVTSG